MGKDINSNVSLEYYNNTTEYNYEVNLLLTKALNIPNPGSDEEQHQLPQAFVPVAHQPIAPDVTDQSSEYART